MHESHSQLWLRMPLTWALLDASLEMRRTIHLFRWGEKSLSAVAKTSVLVCNCGGQFLLLLFFITALHHVSEKMESDRHLSSVHLVCVALLWKERCSDRGGMVCQDHFTLKGKP